MVNRIVLSVWNGAFLRAVDGDESLQAEIGEAIAQLKAKDVPMIVLTECDRAELEPIYQRLNLIDPFITESGSGIFTPVHHNSFDPALGEQDGNYYVQELGCPYVQARAALRVLANGVSHPLKGFGDFTVPKLERFLEISEAAAHRAKAREFSEPFMTPKAVDAQVLVEAAQELGFEIILRDPEKNRFSELVAAGVSFSAAVKQVLSAYQHQALSGEALQVIGISRGERELGAIAQACSSADWKGFSIPPTDQLGVGWLKAIAPLLG